MTYASKFGLNGRVEEHALTSLEIRDLLMCVVRRRVGNDFYSLASCYLRLRAIREKKPHDIILKRFHTRHHPFVSCFLPGTCLNLPV